MLAEHADFTNLRVLVVEDQYLIADDLKRLFRDGGAEVVRLCGTEAAALHQIERDVFNFALVDINLASGPSFTVADALRRRRIPFAFLTGYDDATLPERFTDTPFWQKPLNGRQLTSRIEDVLRG